MHSTTGLTFLALVTVASSFQISSNNPGFPPTGRQGCISTSSNTTGAPVVIQDCGTNFSGQNWNFNLGAGPQALNILGNNCLDVTNGINADGTKLQIWTCVTGNTNQLWIPVSVPGNDFIFQWAGTNKCIDLTDGNTSNGNQLQIWTCDSNNSNQKWTTKSIDPPPPPGAGVRLHAGLQPAHQPVPCMATDSNTDGGRVAIGVCGRPAEIFPAGSDIWVLPTPGTSGPISTYGGTKCLDVRDGNGSNLQIWTCVQGSTNQLWRVNEFELNLISWAGRNKCADVKDGNHTAGNDIQLSDCDANNGNQWWFPSVAS